MKLYRVKVVGWFSKPSIDQQTALFDLVNSISIAWGDRERLGRVKLTITNVSNRHNLESIYTLRVREFMLRK